MSSYSPEEWRAYIDRHWGLPVPDGAKHGRNTKAARVYGCDCGVCLPSGRRQGRRGEGPTKTSTERQREMRERLRGKPVPPTTKHGNYAYRTYGCRCDVCVGAKRAKNSRERQGPPGRAVRIQGGEKGITVVHWPPAILEETWQCPHCDFKAEVPA